MASTGVRNGSFIAVLVGGSIVAHETSSSINLTKDTIEVTTKHSGGNKAYLYGEFDAEIECEAMQAYDASYGFADLMDAMTNETVLTLEFTSYNSNASSPAEETGDYRLTGSALITSLSMNAPQNDAATFSATFKITGGLTKETIT